MVTRKGARRRTSLVKGTAVSSTSRTTMSGALDGQIGQELVLTRKSQGVSPVVAEEGARDTNLLVLDSDDGAVVVAELAGQSDSAIEMAHAQLDTPVGADDDATPRREGLGRRPIGVVVDVDGLLAGHLEQPHRLHEAGAAGDDVPQSGDHRRPGLHVGRRDPLAVQAFLEQGLGLAHVIARPAEAPIRAHGHDRAAAGREVDPAPQ